MTEDRHSHTERDAAREEADRGYHEDPWHPLDAFHPTYDPDDPDPWGRERLARRMIARCERRHAARYGRNAFIVGGDS